MSASTDPTPGFGIEDARQFLYQEARYLDDRDWDAWLAPQSGPLVPARIPGEGNHKAIEDAPGSYVKMRAV